MSSIPITFATGISLKKQKAILRRIERWKAVETARQIMPDSDNEKIQRMAYASLADSVDAKDILKRLKSIPEISKASTPPIRKLVLSKKE